MRKPWEWRKAEGGWTLDTDRYVADPTHPRGKRLVRKFHAYDVNNNAACEPRMGLWATGDEPNEGSDLCPACVDVVQQEPGGRPLREFASR